MTSKTKIGVCVAAVALTTGCYDLSLPPSRPVVVPVTGEVTAKAKTGPVSLANTSWMAYRHGEYAVDNESQQPAYDGPSLIGRIQFGPDGQVVQCDLGEITVDGVSVTALLGETILPDAALHPAAMPATSYVAQSYGLNEGAHFAADVFGKYFVGPIQAATASLMISGTIDDEGLDFEGTMRVSLTYTSAVPDRGSDEAGIHVFDFAVVAERE